MQSLPKSSEIQDSLSAMPTPCRRSPSLLLAALAVSIATSGGGCAALDPPEPLIELREVIDGQRSMAAREAAPELVAEARRTLENAERAYQGRAVGRARWLATLGITQMRVATAISRQRAAQERLEAARRTSTDIEQDLARYRSMRSDALHEIERLEAMRDAANEVGDGD